jgi:hypothetical protein
MEALNLHSSFVSTMCGTHVHSEHIEWLNNFRGNAFGGDASRPFRFVIAETLDTGLFSLHGEEQLGWSHQTLAIRYPKRSDSTSRLTTVLSRSGLASVDVI